MIDDADCDHHEGDLLHFDERGGYFSRNLLQPAKKVLFLKTTLKKFLSLKKDILTNKKSHGSSCHMVI